MLGERFNFVVQKILFLLKFSIYSDKTKDFLQNYRYDNKKLEIY